MAFLCVSEQENVLPKKLREKNSFLSFSPSIFFIAFWPILCMTSPKTR
jgi:hypothetical protein